VTALRVNGTDVAVAADADTPLLWVLRDHLGLTGTKFGCGAGLCGACTVHVDGDAVRSCQLAWGDVAGREVTTIEGLGQGERTPVQQVWIEHDVPQCGYCQPGMIMAVSALLRTRPDLTKEDLVQELTNICRCGTYLRIVDASLAAARLIKEGRG